MLTKLLPVLICLVLVSMSAVNARAHADITAIRECTNCGMDRKVYGYSRMLINFADGSQVGVCSLHCAVIKLGEHKNKKVKSLLVADRDSHQLLAADKAHWVIGGKKRGVMTQRPKWAFATAAAARAFVGSQGGKIVSWDEALAAAREDADLKP
jgi:nitrous oxide reductase accessory protein NosL